ncbi:BlaI/MecI/CopY family transcriptional regulator [Paludisphaera sp.]|uniref:BlaI/MecI/CopY family transcriptional regulator n=1 Tax=Paludisphaera sp. TaxID=2017432 RepID=UPI00301D459C
MARRPSGQPTDAELAILRVLWDAGPSALGAVREAVQASRPVALTTVATTLKVMLDKGLVRREDGPRGYIWSAVATREAAASGMLGKLLDHLFDGSARGLVAHLIEEGALDDRDRRAIRAMLDAADAPKPDRQKEGGGS